MSIKGFAQEREEDDMFRRVVSVPSLYQAWRKVRANRGVAGIDAVSLVVYAERLEANLRELSRSLVSGAYQPLPARFVRVLKANGKERELAILVVRDRVAQRAVLDALEPLIEPRLNDCCFAFRPQRSIEAAVQRLVAARANGFVWTFESDVQNFFGSIDRALLMHDLGGIVGDERVLELVGLWLEAGALNETAEKRQVGFVDKGRERWAGARLLVSETFTESLDCFLAERLGASGLDGLGGVRLDALSGASEYDLTDKETSDEACEGKELSADNERKRRVRRAALKRLIKDGALVALSHRALVGKVLGAKLLGVSGLAVAAYLATPALRELYRNYANPARGTLQGAPVSPLLTNHYMTVFDDSLTKQGWRVIRYCDDFVIQCRTEMEAREAWLAAQKALKNRKLKLHPEKTRIAAPGEAFEFLGYKFEPDGSVIAPPSTPARIAREISETSKRGFRRALHQAANAKDATGASSVWGKIKRIKSGGR